MIKAQSLEEKYLARFSDGTHEALADTLPEYGGKSAGFKPVDMLEAALACCITMVLRIAADMRGIPLQGAAVEVRVNREDKAQTVFEYRIELQGELSDEQRATLLRAAAGCPVKKILGGPVAFKELA